MFLGRILELVAASAFALASVERSTAAEILPGPYAGAVERVVDGDTLAVRVNVWLGQELRAGACARHRRAGVARRLRGGEGAGARCDSGARPARRRRRGRAQRD